MVSVMHMGLMEMWHERYCGEILASDIFAERSGES